MCSLLPAASESLCWKPEDSKGNLIRLQDFCVFSHQGYTYCASMKKDLCNQGIIVARSKDLIDWEVLGDAVSTRSTEDSSMVWAPHVVEDGGTFYMFYTGVTQPAPGQWCQHILVASTKDPSKPQPWQRDQGVKFKVDGAEQSWFRPDHPGSVWSDKAWADCRDPMVIKDGRTWYMFYSGADTAGGICGVATAPSVRGPWTDRGAVLRVTPGIPESCFVLKTKDKNSFVMTFNHAGDFPGRGSHIARTSSGLLPIDGKTPFGDIKPLAEVSDLTGWAHEFLPLKDGKVLAAFLTGYWVNFEDAAVHNGPAGWTLSLVSPAGDGGKSGEKADDKNN